MAVIGDLILMLFTLSSAQLWIIADSVEKCKQYPHPKNGRVVCDSLFSLFCVPECGNGFTFEFKPSVVYMCGPLTGKWFTYPEGEKIPWPDCVKRESSHVNEIEDDVATRRAQIAQKIHETHRGIFPYNQQTQSTQLVGQPNTRYLHLFNYIQRAQQLHMYNDQQSTPLGYKNYLEQQKQLKLKQKLYQEQQKRKQLQFQQQLQRRRQLIQQKKFLQQQQNVQREMIEKQRQQREAFEATVSNFQQNVDAPQSTPWKYNAYQNPQGYLQTNVRSNVEPKAVSTGQAAMLSTYSGMPQVLHEDYSPYRNLQTNYGSNNVATLNINRQQSNTEIKEYAMVTPKQDNIIHLPLRDSQVANTDVTEKEQESLVTVSQPATSSLHPLQPVNRIQSSQQNVTDLNVKALQSNPNSNQSTNQITSLTVDVNPSNQSQYRNSPTSQLQAGNDALKKDPFQLLTQQAERPVNQVSVKPVARTASSVLFPNPSLNLKDLNKTSQIERRGDVEDGPDIPTQEKPKTKEKLFYFPIKRDTLIRMLPLNIQEKYRSLREARNINSSYEASSNKTKGNITALEDTKVQNVTQNSYYPTASVSNLKYSVKQVKTGEDSITEYFNLLPQNTSNIINSTINSSNHSEMTMNANMANLSSPSQTGSLFLESPGNISGP